jgi:hypothetical protein
MVLSQAEKYENRLKKQIEEYEIKDKAQRKQDRLLNDRNNLMNERERENRMKGNYEIFWYKIKHTLPLSLLKIKKIDYLLQFFGVCDTQKKPTVRH